MVLALEDLIFFHHRSQLVFEFLELPDPLFIYDGSVNINWHFNLDWYLYLYLLLYFNRPIDINRLLHEDRFVNDNRLFVDGFLNKDLFLDDLWHFDLFDDDLRNFLLNFDVLGNFDYLLNHSLGPRNILGNFSLDLNWLFHDELLHHFLWHHVVIHLSLFPQDLVLHF